MKHYQRVPTTLKENIQYRIKLRQKCTESFEFRQAVWHACREDVLFFFSAFCFLYEPRTRFDDTGKRLPKMIPFIPWEHQIPAIITMRENLGVKDVVVFKSRGEGFSWIAILLALHDWLFDDMAKIGLVSNTEKKADDPGNMDSLLSKVDWELTNLPSWMVGKKDMDWSRNISKHSLVNHRNGSQLNAFAATKDAGRAGRYKWFLADEIAFWDAGQDRDFLEAVRGSTDSRCEISTPNGSGNEFYNAVHAPSNAEKIRVHWTQNPSKNRGLYKILDGKAVEVDAGNPTPPDYLEMSQDVKDLWSRLRSKGFRLEGNLRSPWYDQECDRHDATPQSIAQELDLDFGGSQFKVFTPEFFAKADETKRKHLLRGDIQFHPETFELEEFYEESNGPLKLWFQLDAKHRPPPGAYAIAADIGSGLGGSYTSNSTFQVLDLKTQTQVAEFASNTIEPGDFGEYCVAVAKWFYSAILGWEMNFGGGYTNRVQEVGYGNVYYRSVFGKRGRKKTKELGWHTNPTSRELMFSELIRRVRNGEVTLRSEDLIRECSEYIRSGPNSPIVHAQSKSTTDESSKGLAHGDRVIAMAIVLQVAKDRNPADLLDYRRPTEAPPNTLAWRMERWREQQKPTDEWDDRTMFDISNPREVSGFLD